MASLFSKAKAKVGSALTKAKNNLVGNVKALTGNTSVKSYTSNTAGGKAVAAANVSPKTNYNALGSVASINSMGGVKTYTSDTKGGQAVAAANANPKTNYKALSSGSSKSGGSSNKSVGSDPFANALPGTSTPSQDYGYVPSYTPSLKDVNTPVTTNEITSNSAVPMGGQTNAGLTNVNAFTGYGDKTVAYLNDYEAGIANKREQAQKETDTTLKYIQDQLGDAAEDTRIDRQDIERQAGLDQAEKEASGYKSEILGIKAQFEAQRQSLIGQGRGIPEVIIGGQQEALDRQEAIKLMPLLAQYQIANDNVTAAKETVNNFIADEQAYLNRVYQARINVLEKAYDLATGREKDAVADYKDAFTLSINNQKDANKLKMDIINSYLDNKQKPPSSLFNYDTSNPNAQNDLMGYAEGITPQVSSDMFGGLSVSTQNKLINSAQEFNSRKEIQKFVATVDAANVLNIVDPKSKNPADHQAIVYGFAKALDPESVVRGEEYEAVKKYSQSLFNKYKGEIKNAIAGTGFLSEDAISDMQTTISNLYNARLPIYQNAYDEKARTINNIAGANIADKIMEGKTGGYSQKQSSGSSGTTSSGISYTIEE